MRFQLSFFCIAVILFTSCGSTSKTSGSNGNSNSSNNTSSRSGSSTDGRTPLLDHNTFAIATVSDDATYGFTEKNPIKVGGVKQMEGPLNERRFLNALAGPNGEIITYNRQGSCCPFETPNGFMNGGLLDKYEVKYKGLDQPLIIYINMYDFGELKAPKGLSIRK